MSRRAAGDIQEFEFIRRAMLNRGVLPVPHDRVKARGEVSKDDWYGRTREQFSKIPHVDILSRIFRIILIPELDNPEVVRKITEWAGHVRPDVIGGLLAAAKRSGADAWQSMMQILQPKLAQLWTADNYMQALWDPSLAPHPAVTPVAVAPDSGKKSWAPAELSRFRRAPVAGDDVAVRLRI